MGDHSSPRTALRSSLRCAAFTRDPEAFCG